MHTQVVAVVEEEHRAISAEKLDKVVAADDTARIVQDSYDEVEDDMLGEEVEEVTAIGHSCEAFLDDPEERFECLEVVDVLYQLSPSTVYGIRFWIQCLSTKNGGGVAGATVSSLLLQRPARGRRQRSNRPSRRRVGRTGSPSARVSLLRIMTGCQPTRCR